ncbi:hypothetical protein MRX96_011614 [Rhipicephalus microplus]
MYRCFSCDTQFWGTIPPTLCPPVPTRHRVRRTRLVKGRQHCPSFGADSSLLLANGVRTEVAVEARNLPSPADNFHCVLDIEGRRERVQARFLNNKIICSQAVYTYQSEIPEQQGTLTVLWNGNTFIGKTNVTLYKCQLLGSHGGRADCSLCLTRDPEVPVFVVRRRVRHGRLVRPARLHHLPAAARRLDSSFEWAHRRWNAVRVVCRTGASGSPLTADVVVGNRAGITQAKEKFHGSNLNVGSNLTVYLDNLPCTVDKTLASNSQISCKTSKATTPKYNVSYLILKIDNATLSIASPFSYSEDPTILKISPLKSFVSGGRNVMVTGSNLHAVQQPRMAVFYENQILNETVCEVLSPSLMSCPSPPINAEAYRQLPSSDRQKSLGKDNRIAGGSHTGLGTSYNNDQDAGSHRDEWRFRIGFAMDDVSSVLELPRTFPLLHSDLVYVPNPLLHRFEGDGVKLYKGELLVIEGSNLRLASTESEFSLPAQMSWAVGPTMDFQWLWFVLAATFATKWASCATKWPRPTAFPPEAVAGLAAGALAVVLLSAVILLVLRHKSSQAEREYKRIQLQMDDLEKSVRIECKQAFAELQTVVTDLTNDLQSAGIPTLDHRSYIMKVFFPGVYEHPLLQDNKVKNNGIYSNYEVAMCQFEQLILNKSFLVTFINTLESQKSFTIRDRVNVASLLMIVFMGRLEYGTE